MSELDISPKFTMEDIKKVREYVYEITRDMTFDELKNFYHESTLEAYKIMAELREQGIVYHKGKLVQADSLKTQDKNLKKYIA
jgi:peptidoglycan hydrolase-like amidase